LLRHPRKRKRCWDPKPWHSPKLNLLLKWQQRRAGRNAKNASKADALLEPKTMMAIAEMVLPAKGRNVTQCL
jgi:hypothetical protein